MIDIPSPPPLSQVVMIDIPSPPPLSQVVMIDIPPIKSGSHD